ncbi:MAG: tRNA-dihydrouridine synthase [Candidatus Woesearchaeota archaeon]|jgi:dihydroorotate dehydrogenase (NAD+) catalytic subunit|nr:tRNA-dihydrouridine synthase [Candidatus Woesearchaeota archaeon]
MLGVELCGVKLESPLVLASGILGVSGKLVSRFKVGAVTMKTLTLESRDGHKNPTILAGDDYLINAVGLSNPGVLEGLREVDVAAESNVVIVSISGGTVADFGKLAEEVSKSKASFIEVNISCPNVEDDLGRPFACTASDAAAVTKIVKENSSLPVIVKLSPNVDDIQKIAKSVEDAGADALCCFNTFGPEENEFLSNKKGGVSGPKIFKKALMMVSDVAAVVKVPVIATGGITYGKDAIEMLKVGATCVGIGSGVYFRGIEVFDKVNLEIKEYMVKKGLKTVGEIR